MAPYRGGIGKTPTAVDRVLRTAQAVETLKSLSTGGLTEQASNIARGTSEKRRTCGIFGTCLDAARHRGSRVLLQTRRPARPHLLGGRKETTGDARACQTTGPAELCLSDVVRPLTTPQTVIAALDAAIHRSSQGFFLDGLPGHALRAARQ